ncbi:MAG TPA: hypothetical protein VMX54_11500, partial [Vicinamibacteria bacterium]|nr:hypothetical protein [Vicinamibacteria bacterium]
ALASSPALALPDVLTAHVPFAFSLGRQTFPAGDYLISPLSTLQQQVLFIRTSAGRHPALVMTQPADAEGRGTQPVLVFDKVGTREFLRAVEVPEDTGAVLPTSRTEIRAERQLALHAPAAGQALQRSGS